MVGDRAVLVDLGVARDLEARSPQTMTGEVLGSHGYIAPEILGGQRADRRSDIFAVGAIIYRCLVGRVPEVGSRPPSDYSVSTAWDRVVARAIDTDPDRRYQNCSDLVHDIEAAAGEEVAAPLQDGALAQAIPCPTIEAGPDHITINEIDFTFGTSIQELVSVIEGVRGWSNLLDSIRDTGWCLSSTTGTSLESPQRASIKVPYTVSTCGWIPDFPEAPEVDPAPSELRLPFVIEPPQRPFEGRLTVGASECTARTNLGELRGMWGGAGSECLWSELAEERPSLRVASPSDDLNVPDSNAPEGSDPLANSVLVTGREATRGSAGLGCVLLVPATSSGMVHRDTERGPGFVTAVDSFTSDGFHKDLDKNGLILEPGERPLLGFSRATSVLAPMDPTSPLILTSKRLLVWRRLLHSRERRWQSEPTDGTTNLTLQSAEMKFPPVGTYLFARFRPAMTILGLALVLCLVIGVIAKAGLWIVGLGESLMANGVVFAILTIWCIGLALVNEEVKAFIRVLRVAFRCAFSSSEADALLSEVDEHPGLELTYGSSIIETGSKVMIWPISKARNL